jgi:hypothetical protein
MFEIRDRATFIPALAVDCGLTGNPDYDYLLRRAGYGAIRCIMLTHLGGGRLANCDALDWRDRTWQAAHTHIAQNWDSLSDGDVIDVQYILGETEKQKQSERFDEVGEI